MSKKKNTLKDLNDFLKQQAATLVAPEKLSVKTEEPVAVKEPLTIVDTQDTITINSLTDTIKAFAEQNSISLQETLYRVILTSLGTQNNLTPEDRMLINTALYLKHGSNWKEAIRGYWKDKK
ncbi:hypothetical protein [Chryseosolibacter indicus]|uniref:Uncharacterized protein n=1 Tax=Chryseosolibacter indicus TaxID=2782351 RepID=A0ABS5VU93_9BACT|nr:hypothetical protein [Chryseosolibacter indicus]MBT1704997.1 hypothetical protein [Chryseosolibacter indicus]